MKVLNLEHYSIRVGDIKEIFSDYLTDQNYSKTVVLADNNTMTKCLPLFESELGQTFEHIITAPAGESHKTIRTCEALWKQMYDYKLDRKALVINLGGGVIGDMGGFCAATYKRGIDFIQIPTTVLSMVDSSIGGKLGVDFFGAKNMIGVFQDPKSVLIDTMFLQTLSKRQIKNGFAETIKHALIANPALWDNIVERPFSSVLINETLIDSLTVKKNIVEEDPFEFNIRKSLNFGHTLGHAIESYYLDRGFDLLHGEAVVLGMIAETYLSHEKAGLSKNEMDQILRYLKREYGYLSVVPFDIDELYDFVLNDKKNEHHRINCTLLSEIGQFEINQVIDYQDVKSAVQYLNSSIND